MAQTTTPKEHSKPGLLLACLPLAVMGLLLGIGYGIFHLQVQVLLVTAAVDRLISRGGIMSMMETLLIALAAFSDRQLMIFQYNCCRMRTRLFRIMKPNANGAMNYAPWLSASR